MHVSITNIYLLLLLQVAAARFKEALQKSDMPAALRFAKLHAPLGRGQQGLQLLVGFLRQVGFYMATGSSGKCGMVALYMTDVKYVCSNCFAI